MLELSSLIDSRSSVADGARREGERFPNLELHDPDAAGGPRVWSGTSSSLPSGANDAWMVEFEGYFSSVYPEGIEDAHVRVKVLCVRPQR